MVALTCLATRLQPLSTGPKCVQILQTADWCARTYVAQCVACQMPSTLYFSKLMASQYANMQMAPTSPDARFGILGRFGVNQSTNKKKNKTGTKSNPQKVDVQMLSV